MGVPSDPATTISLLGSTARQENWVGEGAVSVRKLRYRRRSNARTVPSTLAENTT